MLEGTHRCAVTGCPNLASYEVVHYAFDLAEGAVVFVEDDGCPYICVEHAIENERRATGERSAHAVVEYPFTNAARTPGISIYRQLEPAYVV